MGGRNKPRLVDQLTGVYLGNVVLTSTSGPGFGLGQTAFGWNAFGDFRKVSPILSGLGFSAVNEILVAEMPTSVINKFASTYASSVFYTSTLSFYLNVCNTQTKLCAVSAKLWTFGDNTFVCCAFGLTFIFT